MGPIQVVVEDGNNLVLEVTPTPSTTVILDRGIAGPVGPAGPGDVNGPASSTDNAIARFDGTTGKLIQNSTVTISDAGVLAGVTDLSLSGSVTLSGGTANGVAYLNGSKVLTTGSALTFDGTDVGIGGAPVTGLPLRLLRTSSGAQIRYQNTAATWDAGVTAAGAYEIFSAANTSIQFGLNSSEQMRLTSTGLGIGTSSPAGRLTLRGAAGTSGKNQGILLEYSNGTEYGALGLNNGSGWPQLMARASAGITFHVNSDLVTTGEAMRLDSSGNLGLGVTPSAWATSGTILKALQIGAAGSVAAGTVDASIHTSQNAYFDGSSWRYIQSAAAGNYYINGNTHNWRIASSGTAGDAISFTQAMTLDSSGNLALGQTTALTGGAAARWLTLGTGGGTTYSGGLVFAINGTAQVYQYQDNADNLFYFQGAGSNAGYKWAVGGSERARIDSSGNFIVQANSGNARIYAQDCYTVTGGAAANMVVSSDGGFYRSTSSLKYKKNVQDATHGLSSLLQLRPVTYESKNENEAGVVYGGLIAEEVHEAGLTEFVQYADDRTPDALAYGNMVSLCIKAIQEQQAIITTLTARVAALESSTLQ